jgi:hypothetical protein
MWWFKSHWVPSLFVGILSTVIVSVSLYNYNSAQSEAFKLALVRSFILGFGVTYLVLYFIVTDEYSIAIENALPGEPDF